MINEYVTTEEGGALVNQLAAFAVEVHEKVSVLS
jgi:hypothetical protein